MKRAIYIIFVLSILITIYCFSSQSAYESNRLSKGIINNSVEIYKSISHKDINNARVINKANYVLRKGAHFVEFLILGIAIYLLINTTNIKNKIFVSILLCFSFACFDEAHQLMNGMRDPRIIDVFIDTCGSLTAFILLYKFGVLEKKHIKK